MPLGHIFSCLFTVTFSNLMFALISKNVLSSNNAVNIRIFVSQIVGLQLVPPCAIFACGKKMSKHDTWYTKQHVKAKLNSISFFSKKKGAILCAAPQCHVEESVPMSRVLQAITCYRLCTLPYYYTVLYCIHCILLAQAKI